MIDPTQQLLERLRQREAALREALEVMLESTQPDSTMGDVFDARDHAQTVLAQLEQPVGASNKS